MTKSKLLRLFKELKHEGAVISLYDTYKAKYAELEALVADKYVHTDERTITVKDLYIDDIIRMFERAEHVNSNIVIEDYDQPEVAATYRDLYDTLVSEKRYKSRLVPVIVEETKRLHDEFYEANKERIESVKKKRLDDMLRMYKMLMNSNEKSEQIFSFK